MSFEVTSKRLTAHIGDKIVVTDIDICQRVLPATVAFNELQAYLDVDRDTGVVSVEFEGYENDGFYDGEDDLPAAKELILKELADMLEGDGVIVTGRPAE